MSYLLTMIGNDQIRGPHFPQKPRASSGKLHSPMRPRSRWATRAESVPNATHVAADTGTTSRSIDRGNRNGYRMRKVVVVVFLTAISPLTVGIFSFSLFCAINPSKKNHSWACCGRYFVVSKSGQALNSHHPGILHFLTIFSHVYPTMSPRYGPHPHQHGRDMACITCITRSDFTPTTPAFTAGAETTLQSTGCDNKAPLSFRKKGLNLAYKAGYDKYMIN